MKLSLLEFITLLGATLLMERNLILFISNYTEECTESQVRIKQICYIQESQELLIETYCG